MTTGYFALMFQSFSLPDHSGSQMVLFLWCMCFSWLWLFLEPSRQQGRTQGREALLLAWPSGCFSLSTSNHAIFLCSDILYRRSDLLGNSGFAFQGFKEREHMRPLFKRSRGRGAPASDKSCFLLDEGGAEPCTKTHWFGFSIQQPNPSSNKLESPFF